MQTCGFSQHDHSGCITNRVEDIVAYCAANGVQLTPVRRRVLEYLLAEHRAFGAYEILEKMVSEGLGAQPPAAYRALDFLVKHGFAHKIEKLNAFVACAAPTKDHDPAFLICRSCSAISETQTQPRQGALGRAAREAGFAIETTVVEAEGLCPNCQPPTQ